MTEARSKPLSLQELALLNQEIAALVRAGVPLESGLAMAGASGRGAQEVLMLRLAQRLREGHSFAEALHTEGGELPRMYRAWSRQVLGRVACRRRWNRWRRSLNRRCNCGGGSTWR